MAISYSVPTVHASGTIEITDFHDAPSSTFPYDSMGPISFQQLNFVNTCEEDYYYSQVYPNGATPLLVSKVTQCYQPAVSFGLVLGLAVIAFLVTWAVVKFVKKPVKY